MKNSVKILSFCLVLFFAMAVSAMAKDNYSSQSVTPTNYINAVESSSLANCSVVGAMCDAAKSAATSASQSAGKICGKDASSQDCSAALDNSRKAAGVAFDTCLVEALIEELMVTNQKPGEKSRKKTSLAE